MMIIAEDLQRSLADVERFVTSSSAQDLRAAAGAWALPTEVRREMLRVCLSLISFRPTPRSGKFLVLSGVDKSGKETHCFNQSRLLRITSVYDHLRSLGFNVFPINLPAYDTLLGSLVGAYLGRKTPGVGMRGQVSNKYAWILWSMDRAQFNQEVDSWLARSPKNIVLAKRWTESHAVYQPEEGVEYSRVMNFEGRIVKQDATVVLDISPAQAMQRLKTRTDRDNYEHASLIERVRMRYLTLSKIYPYGDVFLVDASRDLEDVNRDILGLVDGILQVEGNG
jgi:thymidylate kinase